MPIGQHVTLTLTICGFTLTTFSNCPASSCMLPKPAPRHAKDRKSTRLNSSYSQISYAVFCLKKKKHNRHYSWRKCPSSDTRCTTHVVPCLFLNIPSLTLLLCDLRPSVSAMRPMQLDPHLAAS